MANYFTLELDTTGPEITITAPFYTIPQIETEIWVRASEQLSSYQEFYILDGEGKRYDLIFEHLGDSFRGIYYFNDVPLGICTIYARVKDEVHNLSSLASTAINVRQPAPLQLTIGKRQRPLIVESMERTISESSKVKQMNTGGALRQLNTKAVVREVRVNNR